MTKSNKNFVPPLTTEAQDIRLKSLTVSQVEEQLINKKASSQILLHYLELDSPKTRLANEKLQLENDLLRAKIEAEKSTATAEALIRDVFAALTSYSANPGKNDEDLY